MTKLTEEMAKARIRAYFASRKREKRGQDGDVLLGKNGEILYEESPCTVSGLALALGFSDRESLSQVKNKKIKALLDRALLKIEEQAEEALFSKDTFQGAKLFLESNFTRWQERAPEESVSLGVFSTWAE